ARVAGVDPPEAEALPHCMLDRGIIGYVRVRCRLDVADEAVEDFSNPRIRALILRVDLDRRLVLARVIDDLPNEGGHLVEREARPLLQLALPADPLVPLPPQPREFQVLPGFFLVIAPPLTSAIVILASLGEDI